MVSPYPIVIPHATPRDDPRLDRLPSFDNRSRDYSVRWLVSGYKPRSYTWRCPVWLNQGSEGACVGYAFTHEAIGRPAMARNMTREDARALYLDAQKVDEWPGEGYAGTSVLAGAKTSVSRGWFDQYRWAFGIDDLVLALGYKGPAVLGINWYTGMFTPDATGLISPTGSIAGGHAILATGISVRLGVIRLHNSWGSEWGHGGDCFITIEDVSRLLREWGEACIPMNRNQFVE